MELINCFQDQINITPELSDDVLAKVEFKRVWSGKLIESGDRVLYAFLKSDETLLLFIMLERELEELSSIFVFDSMYNETIPILRKIR